MTSIRERPKFPNGKDEKWPRLAVSKEEMLRGTKNGKNILKKTSLKTTYPDPVFSLVPRGFQEKSIEACGRTELFRRPPRLTKMSRDPLHHAATLRQLIREDLAPSLITARR